ncbi:sugar transferase [Zobellella aerophila]|uniref:Sugar transferase n=1 Tax=Zobellella aerophila TaxID=870480 RepID=A0ABP6VM82_9GAMM
MNVFTFNANRINWASSISKRVFDVIVSILALIILSPVFVIVALEIRKNLGYPVLFRQTRPGKNGKPFEIIKFRTMREAIGDDVNLLENDKERMTPLGALLRSTSLDELPELWNVLKGDMSLVGPRPLLMEYLPLYNSNQFRRHEIRPGITGWAQVNGRNSICWDDKFKLDVWYVDNQSFFLDVKILFLTVKKVILRDGISTEGYVTSGFFTGNNSDECDKGDQGNKSS